MNANDWPVIVLYGEEQIRSKSNAAYIRYMQHPLHLISRCPVDHKRWWPKASIISEEHVTY